MHIPGPGHGVLKASRYAVNICGESTGPPFPDDPDDDDLPDPDDWTVSVTVIYDPELNRSTVMHDGAAVMLCRCCGTDAGLMPAPAGNCDKSSGAATS